MEDKYKSKHHHYYLNYLNTFDDGGSGGIDAEPALRGDREDILSGTRRSIAVK